MGCGKPVDNRAAGIGGAVQAADLTVHETGSTLLYPLFQLWIPAYETAHPGVVIQAEASNSGNGIEQALAGHVDLGASDAYMSDEQAEHNPDIVNIPIAISAMTVTYNLPGSHGTDLRLDGPTLSGIYSGTITYWDAPQIVAQNPGIHLPHQTIIPIRRGDPSGDTFIFTQFLDFSTPSWENSVGYGSVVTWPSVAAEQTAEGNEGVLHLVANTPYAITYLGVSLHDEVAKAGLSDALLKNQAGAYVQPTAETVNAAASGLDERTPPDERLSLVFAPGEKSYPLIAYEYAVVSVRQHEPQMASALRAFLLWSVSLDGGNAPKYLDAVGFIPLPDFIRALSEKQTDRIRQQATN